MRNVVAALSDRAQRRRDISQLGLRAVAGDAVCLLPYGRLFKSYVVPLVILFAVPWAWRGSADLVCHRHRPERAVDSAGDLHGGIVVSNTVLMTGGLRAGLVTTLFVVPGLYSLVVRPVVAPAEHTPIGGVREAA